MTNTQGDCRILALHELLSLNGFDLTPAMCFGIGEGLTFSYWVEHVRSTPVVVFVGRSLETEQVLCRHLGVRLNESKAVDLDDYLNKDIPLMVYADRYYLDYFRDAGYTTHVGYHSFVVSEVERDREGHRWYTVQDYIGKVKVSPKIHGKHLSIARESEWQPFPPEKRFYYLDNVTSAKTVDNQMILTSVRNNCNRFLNDSKQGITSLHHFIQELDDLRSKIDFTKRSSQHFLKFQLGLFFSYIYEFEVEHSLYRKLYAQFVNEIQEPLGMDLSSISRRFLELGSRWENVAHQLRSVDDYGKTYSFALGEIREIAKDERNAVTSLWGKIGND